MIHLLTLIRCIMHDKMLDYPKLNKETIGTFAKGKNFSCYEMLGAHEVVLDGRIGTYFALWAPFAISVQVIGTFNSWQEGNTELSHIDEGIFGVFVEGAKKGDAYKYRIVSQDGKVSYKADPYAFFSEIRPKSASVIFDIDNYRWTDAKWINKRKKTDHFKKPLNIYEVHLGSWKKPAMPKDKNPQSVINVPYDKDYHTHVWEEGFCSYRDLVSDLIPYVKEMGYTHIELLPITEHPFDGSWGYQATGYFSVTSRFGTPDDFMFFVDSCHNEGIGVLLDWVPGHFCPDDHGLANFNGNMLYERALHKEWGTYKFNFSKPEVRSFLFSSASFWFDKYHIDGIRVDGVTSMVYLNYGLNDNSQFSFNKYGGDKDLDALSFLSELNENLAKMYPGILSVAEESTALPLVTYPPHEGGLGFHYKWDMGWMNDSLEYISKDFPYRPYHHNLLTFSMMYAFNENFILPFSHDEVVHGKKSLIGRMPGDYWRQFANLRLLNLYQITHSGAKLNFMGNEIGQFIEWRYYEGVEWFLLEYDSHKKHQHYIKSLNHMYLKEKSLWSLNYGWDGYEWIEADNHKQGVLIYKRKGDKGDFVIIALNFHPDTYENYKIGVPLNCKYEEIFNSDNEDFGGSGKINKKNIESSEYGMHGQPYSIEVTLPPLGGTIIRPIRRRL